MIIELEPSPGGLPFRSLKDDWQTPTDLFELLDHEHRFVADACATKDNALCKYWFKDCLALDSWVDEIKRLKPNNEKIHFKKRAIFMNPPYSNVGPFLKKAFEQSEEIKVVCLLPNSILTCKYMDVLDLNKGRDLIRRWDPRVEFQFLRRRTRFTHPIKDPSNPPGGCMVLIFNKPII